MLMAYDEQYVKKSKITPRREKALVQRKKKKQGDDTGKNKQKEQPEKYYK